MKKVLVVFMLFLSLFSFPKVNNAEGPFKDISQEKEGFKEVQFLYEREIIKGYPDGTFKPNMKLLTSQILIMLLRVMDFKISEDYPDPQYSNIKKGDYGYDVLASAVEAGLLAKGDGRIKFEPNREMTRAQMAKHLVKVFKLSRGWEEKDFTDVGKYHWSYGLVEPLAAYGVTRGYPDNTFKPNNSLTRMQFTLFVYRAMNITDEQRNRQYSLLPIGTTSDFNGLRVTVNDVKKLNFDGDIKYLASYTITNISNEPLTYGAFRFHLNNQNKSMMLGSSRQLRPGESVKDTTSVLIYKYDIEHGTKPIMLEFYTDSVEINPFQEPYINSLKWEIQ